MLLTVPLADKLLNKFRTARRVAVQIASAFVPTGNLTPVINEVLCYGCMAGIAMPVHYGIALCDRDHVDDCLLPENQQPLAAQAAPHEPQWLPCDTDDVPPTIAAQIQKSVKCHNAGTSVLRVQIREADSVVSRRMFMLDGRLGRPRTALPTMPPPIGSATF